MSSLLDCLSPDKKESSPETENLLSNDEIRTSRAMSRETPLVQVVHQRQMSIQDIPWSNTLKFYLNGSTIELHNPNPTSLLAHYVRDTAGLYGTKLGCEEGGCGACTVSLTKKNGTMSVNSCLRPLCANDGMGVITVEGVGSVKSGLSVEQDNMVASNATQCGFCTPGWVVNMHALNEANSEKGGNVAMSQKEVENYFDGNICRCTGYRPIMKAAYGATLACPSGCAGKERGEVCKHAVGSLDSGCGGTGSSTAVAIEDLANQDVTRAKVAKGKCTPMGSRRNKELINMHQALPLRFEDPITGTTWYRPVTFEQLCTVIRETSMAHPSAQIQFVGGNTSIGVTKYLNQSAPYNTEDVYDVFVDINEISELQQESYDADTRQLTVGSTRTISDLINLLHQYEHNSSSGVENVDHSSVFSVTSHHLALIANTQVRNAGSWAGNLGIFNRHQEFPSDAVLALTLAQATLTVSDMNGNISTMTMDEFIQLPADSFLSHSSTASPECLIIVAVTLQESAPPTPTSRSLVTESYKICVREHNAHAQVNAGFSFVLEAPQAVSSSAKAHGLKSQVNIGRGQLAMKRANHKMKASPPLCVSARIVFGGVSNKTFVAARTQVVFSNAVLSGALLQSALVALQQDLQEAGGGLSNSFGDPTYRESVMQSCLYRAVLRCYGKENLPSNLQSVLLPFVKPPSSG